MRAELISLSGFTRCQDTPGTEDTKGRPSPCWALRTTHCKHPAATLRGCHGRLIRALASRQGRERDSLGLWSPQWAPLCSLLIPLLLSGHNFDFCYSNFSKIFSLLLLHKPYYRYPLFLSWYPLNSTFGFLRGQAAQM